MFAYGAYSWLCKDGLFAHAFPVKDEHKLIKTPTQIDLGEYEDLVAITEKFKATFYNAGMMFQGRVYSEELTPDYAGPRQLLNDIVSHEEVDKKYFISEANMPKWEYLKGAKKIEHTSKTGFSYNFSEGPIAFPDPLDRPARTMLTSEGTTNRSSHVIIDRVTGQYRRLTPEECEQINGFDIGWTDTGMPERQRYFIMGNALVVPLIEKMGKELLNIF